MDRAVLDEEIAAFHQLDPHLLREERVLEIRAVVLSGREHCDHRVAHRGRRRGTQRLEQESRVVLDGVHVLPGEQLRE